MYYLKIGFRITTLHVDGEFAPIQVLIQQMPGETRVNLASSSGHVTSIETDTSGKGKYQVYKTHFTFKQGC